MLNRQLLNELETILKEDYGLVLNQNEAKEIGNTLVKFFELLANIGQTSEKRDLKMTTFYQHIIKKAYILGTHKKRRNYVLPNS